MKSNKAISHELHVGLASNPAVIPVLGHNPERHNPDRTQPEQTQPGQTQPKQGSNLDRTHPGQDITWTGRNLDKHNPDRDITRTRTDSVFNPDNKKIIYEYITIVPYIQT